MNCKSSYFFTTIVLIGLRISSLSAQDLHFSQFDLNPLYLSPALSGMYSADWKAAVQYRSQWETVPVQYRTMAGSYDAKLFAPGNNLLAAGILLAKDQAGDAGLSWSQVGFRLNAAHSIGKSQALSAGFGLDFVQRKIDLTALKFKNQWNGDAYDPALPSKENLRDASGVKPSMSAGINWHFQSPSGSRTVADIGIGASHLNTPPVHLSNNEPSSIPVRFNIYGISCFQNTEVMDYIVLGQVHYMKSASGVLIGGGVRYWLSDITAVRATLSGRWKDALVPAVQIQQNQWTVGLSYDINLSPFKVATQRKGGFEVAVTYTPTSVKPLKELKVCPIF